MYNNLLFKLVWSYSAEQEHFSYQPPESEQEAAEQAYLTPSIKPIGEVLFNGLTEQKQRALHVAHGDANAMHFVNVH